VPRIAYLTADALVHVTGDDWRSRRVYTALANLANSAAAAAADPRRAPALLLISRPAASASASTTTTAVAGDVTEAFFRLHETAANSASGTTAHRPAGLFSNDVRRSLGLRDRFRDVAVFCLPSPVTARSAATKSDVTSFATGSSSSKSGGVAAIAASRPAAGENSNKAHGQEEGKVGR
jgi:hypothetical protein